MELQSAEMVTETTKLPKKLPYNLPPSEKQTNHFINNRRIPENQEKFSIA